MPVPPVLRVVEFDRVAVRLGDMWRLDKDGRRLVCVLMNHPVAAWELRMEMGAELIRSQACRTEIQVFDTADEWRDRAVAKGWTA